MPTDPDDRLRAAGERYRDTHRTPAVIVFEPRTRRPRSYAWFAAAATVAVLAAAGTFAVRHAVRSDVSAADEMGQAELAGPTWVLSTIDSGHGATLVRGQAMTLRIKASMLQADDACNALSGPAQVDRTTVTFGQIGSTLVLCKRAGADPRTSFHELLRGAVSWRVDDDRLTLWRGQIVARFTEGPDPALLADTTWSLTSWRSGSRTETVASTGQIALAFIGTGRIDINIGCGVSAESSASTSTFTIVSLRVNACAGGTPGPPYLSLLTHTVQWELNGAQLTLRRGSLQFEFVPAPR